MRIAINGIGVAGPTLAYWLRRFGHEPVLFEKAPALRTGGYLIDFWGLGYEIANRMRLIPILRERGYLMERLQIVDADGREEAALDLTPVRALLDGCFISLSRADLSGALFDACAGITAHFGVYVEAVAEDHNGVIASLSDGRQERFDLVVGADGLHSRVREVVFGREERFARSLDCYVAAFRIRGYSRRDELTYVSRTIPKRHVARVTLRDDETLVLLVCRRELIGGDPPEAEQKVALRRAFDGMGWEVPDILDGMDDADDLYFDGVTQIHLPTWASGRVGLLGDAAACASFLAGEGAGLAMTEAYLLAGELHRADGDVPRAFAAYEGRLRAFVAAKQKAALRFRSFFVPQTAVGVKVRDAVVNALSSRFLAKRLFVHSLHDDVELPEYLAA